MPLDPIEYRVLLDVQAALRQISTANGYHHDLAGLAVKLDPNQLVETLVEPDGLRPFAVLDVRPETWTYSSAQDQVGGVLRDQAVVTLPITVHWINGSDPTTDESWVQQFFRGCADVEQALGMDSTRGGLAVQTHLLQRTPEQARDRSEVWAMVDFEILIYRTLGLPNGYPTS
jgi:hypothetical protein